MNERCPHGLWPEACEQCLRDEVSALAARLAEAGALLREAQSHMAVAMHVTMTGIPPDSLLARIDAFLARENKHE